MTSLLRSSATIRVATQATADNGTPTWTYTNSSSTVRCAIQPKDGSEALSNDHEEGVLSATGYFAPKYDDGTALTLNHDDRVLVGGISYRVRGPSQDMAGRGRLLRVNLEREV